VLSLHGECHEQFFAEHVDDWGDSKVSTCWAGKAVTNESGRFPTQVSIGLPLAGVILTSVFLGEADPGNSSTPDLAA
jgi:hypothetical protein